MLTDVAVAVIAGLLGLGVLMLQLGLIKRRLVLRLRRVRAIEEVQRQGLERLRRDQDLLRDRLTRLESLVGRQGTLPELLHQAPTACTAGQTYVGHAGLALLGPGQVLGGRYHIERKIGQGGMGVVYAAHDAELEQRVALKVLSSADGALADRLRNEATAARTISHDNVIHIHGLHESDGLLYLSMEHFEGQTLAEILLRSGLLSIEAAKDVLRQVADGLAAAHAAGVVHRDLKPENVLVSATGQVKLIDFGLARASFLPSLTRTGSVMGTPEYMAPEQVQGGEVDARTDVYALGCLAYHLLTGQPPFLADTPIGVAFRQCSDRPTRLRTVRPELPRAMEAAVLQALAKDKDHRFADVPAMKAALLKEWQPSQPVLHAMHHASQLPRRQRCEPAAA